jgi:AcrR family transcriptional regulator
MATFEGSPFVLPPQQERSRIALARIIAGAVEVMGRKGSDNFSMAEIAEAAQIPLGSIYRRFKGKDSIVQAILLDIFTRCEDIIRNRMQERSFTSASEVVAELASGFAEMSEQNAELFRVFVRHPVTSDELLDVVMKGRRRLVSYYREAISVHLQSVPEQRRDIVIGISYHIVSSAMMSKARRDTPTLIDLSWSDLAQELSKAAAGYLKEAV